MYVPTNGHGGWNYINQKRREENGRKKSPGWIFPSSRKISLTMSHSWRISRSYNWVSLSEPEGTRNWQLIPAIYQRPYNSCRRKSMKFTPSFVQVSVLLTAEWFCGECYTSCRPCLLGPLQAPRLLQCALQIRTGVREFIIVRHGSWKGRVWNNIPDS